ncbi:MAG TPA: VWA domain-containing protein [Thermoanaerobaculia bacterium]|nr:VWA domain-containing protein [Thermoanaerobaculia bacterium]
MTRRILSIFFLVVASALLPVQAQTGVSAPHDVQKLSRGERKERIKNLSDKYRQFLTDVDPIMQPEELDTFLQLESDAQRDLYIDDFWQRRAKAKGVSVNEVREQYYDRLKTAKEKYRSVASDRGKIYVIQGEPLEVKMYGGFTGCKLIQPLEVWTYGYIPEIGRNVRLVFYQPRTGIDYRLWLSMKTARENLADLISQEIMALSEENEAAAIERVFGVRVCGYELITRLECECLDGKEILKVIQSSQITQTSWLNAFKPPPVNAEDVRKILHSIVLANPTAPQLPANFSIAFPARRGNRTDAQMTILVPRSKLVMKEVSGVKLYSIDVVGEVLKEDQLFETYRYRFDYPYESASDPIAVVIDRFLQPAEYKSRIKLTDLNSNAEAVVEKMIVVPDIGSGKPAAAADDIESNQTKLRIVPLPDALLSGPQHIDTITSGDDIKAVEFYLDATKIMTKRTPPFALDLDLGAVPQVHHVRAIALNAKGEFVAGDELVVNSGGGDFRVRIVSPRVAMKLSGRTRVQMAVTLPEGKKLQKLELYLNETRLATLYEPPFVQTVDLPSRLGYLRAVATLDDPDQPPVEDVVMINTPQYMQEVSVHLVELPTTVIRDGHPVGDLPQSAFSVFDEGQPVKLARFEHVTNLPLAIGLAIDTSTSMQPRLAEAQKAGAEFLINVMKKGDRAFLVSFDAQPHVVQRWTSNIAEVTTGLAKLRTDESTALYDAIVYSLYNFAGAKGQKALVVITDGKDTSSKFSFDQALEYARRAGVPVYGIGVGISTSEIDVRYKFGKFCGETGGGVYYIDQVSDLRRIYDAIQSELRSQYLLGFYPAESAKRDSKWHAVTVQVSEGKAKTIRGYYP